MAVMKRLVKWLFRLLLLAVAVLVLAVVFRDAILKAVAEHQIRAETGLDARVGKFHMGLREPVVRLENLKIYNTDEFGGGPLVNLPELHIQYDRAALFSQKLHLTLMRFNLAEVNVVESRNGKSNLDVLQEKQKETAARGKKVGVPIEFTGIDTLRLTLGQLRFSSMKNPSQGRIITLGVKDYELKNVKSTADLSGLLLVLMMKNGGDFLGTGFSTRPGAAMPTVKGSDGIPAQATQRGPDGNPQPLKKRP